MIHLVRNGPNGSRRTRSTGSPLSTQSLAKEKSTGSIVFYAFPQELVNMIAERTGGRRLPSQSLTG